MIIPIKPLPSRNASPSSIEDSAISKSSTSPICPSLSRSKLFLKYLSISFVINILNVIPS